MKNLTYAILAAVLFSGCGIFKKREVNKAEGTFSQVKAAELKTDSSSLTIDKTVTVETKKVDTTVYTPEKRIGKTTSFDWGGLKNGLTLLDSSLATVDIKIDTALKTITLGLVVKPQALNVNVDDRKVTYADKTEQATKTSSGKNKESTEAKNESKVIVAQPKSMAWLWAVVATVAAIIAGAVLLYFKKRKKIPV